MTETIETFFLTVTASPAKFWANSACTTRRYPDIKKGTTFKTTIKVGSNYGISGGYIKGKDVKVTIVNVPVEEEQDEEEEIPIPTVDKPVKAIITMESGLEYECTDFVLVTDG